MPHDGWNLDASPNGDGGSDELTREFLPGFEPHQVVQETCEENYRGGGEEVSNNFEVTADHFTE
jgi:hypothetical protein